MRAALAKPAGVDAVERLTASFDLARAAATGCMSADASARPCGRACVVTLEPVVNEIDEAVDVDFAPARAAAAAIRTRSTGGCDLR